MSDFDPAEQPQPASPSGQGAMGGLAEGWRNWLDDNRNRAALMQFGIAMMQPPQFGQTGLGQFGNSIAEGGVAAENVDKQKREDAESQSLQTYRKDIASARSQTAGAAETTANARALNADTRAMNPGGGLTANAKLQAQTKAITAFKQWALMPGDPLTKDPILESLGVTSKAEVINNPALKQKAIKLLYDLDTTDLGGGAPAPAPGPQSAVAPGGGQRMPNLTSGQVLGQPPPNQQDFRAWAQNPGNARMLTNLKAAIRTQSPKALQDAKHFEQYLTPDSVPAYREFLGIK